MNDKVAGDLSQITPKVISEAADEGDELAIEIWTEVGTYLGVGIGNCINIFAPDVVAVGGQIAKAGEWLIGPARRAAENVAIPSLFEDARIVQAESIDDAGMLGGAALALQGHA
jgi:glucokinase